MLMNLGQGEAPKPLPLFRKDLEMFPGPDDVDGSPTYKLFDPVTGRFFRVTWGEATILRLLKPGLTAEQLQKRIELKSSLHVTAEELEYFFEDAKRNGLTEVPKQAAEVEQVYKRMKNIPFRKQLPRLIFLRIPLVNPDSFLEKSFFIWKFLTSKWMFYFYLSFTIIGLSLLFSRFGEFIHSFPNFFNFEGIATYIVAIAGVKIIHEFAHAYTAKKYGVRVPKMGVMFIITMPLLFTDVTDSWKLPKRSQRFAISVAGIVAELTIAGLCTFAWAISNPGPLQNIFFVLSSTTWISTLLVNLNPAMQFDGYYLLSDAWGIENLRPRAFEVAKWWLRKTLWGLELPCPEPDASKKRLIGLTIYSYYAWVYRFFLYIGIGTMIYFLFTKFLAILFFFVQIFNMIIAPIFTELQTAFKLRKNIKMNAKIITTFTCLGLFLVWFIVPLPHKESFSGIVIPIHNQTVYIPSAGEVEKIFVERNDWVDKGDPLVKIHSEVLENEIQTAFIDKRLYEAEIKVLEEDEDGGKVLIAEKISELATINEKLKGLIEKDNQNLLTASMSGTLYSFDSMLKVGQFVKPQQVVGEVAQVHDVEVVGFLPEKLSRSLEINQKVTFRLPDTLEEVTGVVTKINAIREETLTHPQLASVYSKDIEVTERQGKLKIVDSYYLVNIKIEDDVDLLKLGQTGKIYFWSTWGSKAMSAGRWIANLVWKEANF